MTEDKSPERAEPSLTDEQLIDGARGEIMRWLKDPGADAQETLVEVVKLFERSGRHFVKTDYPAND